MKNLLKLALVFLLSGLPVAAQKVRIYVLNTHDTVVHVIDPVTNKVVQKIEGIPHAHGVTFSPDSRHAYFTSETKDILYDVDTTSGKILRKVSLSSGNANLPTITEDGKRIFVCVNARRNQQGLIPSTQGGYINVVDVPSFTVTKAIRMKGGMHDCYTTPDKKHIVATSLGGKFMSVFDPNTAEILWTLDFDHGITTSAFERGEDGSTNRIFSSLSDYHGFAIVDFATHKEVGRIQLPPPNDFRLAGDLLRRNQQPTHGTGITPDGKTLWVVSRASNGVFIYSLPKVKLIKYIPTPVNPVRKHPDNSGDPGWICFTPDGTRAYIPNAAIDSVSVIDTKTMKLIAVISVGRQPDHVETLILVGK